MASLLDTIKQNMNNAGSAQQPTQASEQDLTGQTQKLMQAKSGKAVGPSTTPRLSNVGEQQANNQAALGQQALAQQVAQGTAQLNQQATNQQAQITQQTNEQVYQGEKVDTDFLNSQEAMLDQYLQGQKQLDMKKDKAKFEQLGFNLRLQDQTYLDNMQREAKRSMLDNDVKFKEEQARTVFSEELGMFQDNLEFRSSLFADKLSFNEEMSQMDLNYAVQLAEMNANQASANSMFTGISGIVSGGAGLMAAQGSKKPADKPVGTTQTGSSTEQSLPSSKESMA